LRLAGANPRDQMTKAEKRNSADAYAGKVEYGYCLTCGGALAYRKEYSTTVSTTITSWKRYEYDGINLLRVDEKCDDDNPTNGIDSGDPWRTLEVSTHRPGMLGNLLGKRFYEHTNNDATPDSTYDYFYGYDRVGNLVFVYEGGGSGDEAFYFTQDAFGNQLNLGHFNGDSWATARAVGVTEHQTGKWLDPFTGMYYGIARWYDPETGRWVSRDPGSQGPIGSCEEGGTCRAVTMSLSRGEYYVYNLNTPSNRFDPDGARSVSVMYSVLFGPTPTPTDVPPTPTPTPVSAKDLLKWLSNFLKCACKFGKTPGKMVGGAAVSIIDTIENKLLCPMDDYFDRINPKRTPTPIAY